MVGFRREFQDLDRMIDENKAGVARDVFARPEGRGQKE
jgi:hypothetical protein